MSSLLRKIFALTLGMAFTLTGAAVAAPQERDAAYPSQLVRIIVPFAPGGFTDAIARFYAQKLSEKWGQSVIVDNRAGGNGIIGTNAAAKADPDGHTLLFTNGTLNTLAALGMSLPYDVANDFTPITTLGATTNLIVVKPDSPLSTLQNVVDAAKSEPGKLTYSSAQIGSGGHFLMAIMEQATGTRFNHVPYKGAAPAMMATLSGEVAFSATSVAGALAQVKAGTIRAIAVNGEERSEFLPDVPTFSEAGFPEIGTKKAWLGVFAPAGLPDTVAQRLYADLKEISETPEAQALLRTHGQEADPTTPEQFAARLATELKDYTEVAKASNIVAQ